MEDVTGLGEIATAAASIANNFIDKISNAVGVVYTDSNYKIKKKNLKKVNELILQRTDLDEFTKLAIISNLEQDMKHYNNQRSIIQKAILNVDEDVESNNVDDDWLLFFFDKAKNISSDEMQNVWAKMLSEEFNKPQSIPKSLLHTVSCIDIKLANAFNVLCQFTASYAGEMFICFKIKEFDNELRNCNLDFKTLTELDRYGLISFSSVASYVYNDVYENKKICTKNHEIIVKPNENGEIDIGNVIFTIDGKALYNCIEKKEHYLLVDMIHKVCNKLIIEDKIIE